MNALFHRAHALLIGVGGNLPCTIRDVEGLRDILVNPERCAYPPDQVRLLTEENASVENIRAELKRLAKVIEKDKRGSTVIVYFSGHGGYVQSREGEAYSLVASGCGRNESQETTMRGTDFTALLEDIRAERLLLVLDCCHAGGIELPLAKGVAYKELSPQVRTILASKQGRVVLASSTGAELSWTGEPYSAFTHSLLEALCGEGNPRCDGFVRVGDVVTYTSDRVPQKTNQRQHPTFDFNKSDNFEIAYYGGGDTKVKSLPFGSWKSETMDEVPTATETPLTEIVVGGTIKDPEDQVEITGMERSGFGHGNEKIRVEPSIIGAKKKVSIKGANIDCRSGLSKRSHHGE